jgi:hypothetical protein
MKRTRPRAASAASSSAAAAPAVDAATAAAAAAVSSPVVSDADQAAATEPAAPPAPFAANALGLDARLLRSVARLGWVTPTPVQVRAADARWPDWQTRLRLLNGSQRPPFSSPPFLKTSQAAALPVLLLGRDAIVRARTGTGKTGAYALALLQKLIAGGGSVGGGRCVRCARVALAAARRALSRPP